MNDPTDKTVSEADESSEEVELSKETLEDLDASEGGRKVVGGAGCSNQNSGCLDS